MNVDNIAEDVFRDDAYWFYGTSSRILQEAMDKRVESRYNKGSNDIPIEEVGPARYRHFAREVAAETPFDVTCKPHAVFVLHHFRDEYDEMDYYANKHGMVEVDVVGDESIFVHQSNVEEWSDVRGS